MGVGAPTGQPSLIEGCRRRPHKITGQKPIVTKAQKSIAAFKLREGAGHRRQGDAARRPDVGVPRPADLGRHPPDPRLPRAAGPLVGRPRQLHLRPQRADDVPRDRPGQDRPASWHGHHDRDDRQTTTPPARHCSTRTASRSRSGADADRRSRRKKQARGPAATAAGRSERRRQTMAKKALKSTRPA